jgi:hypothetical protein
MSTRRCGVCRRPPREGEALDVLRIGAGDQPVGGAVPSAMEPGLYHACPECREAFRFAVARRLGKEPEALAKNDWV